MTDFSSLKAGDFVEGAFAIRSTDGAGEGLRDYSNKPGGFFVLRLGNKTGDMTVKYWGGKNPETAKNLFSSLAVGDVLSVKGKCMHDSYSKETVISVNEEVRYGSPEEYLKKMASGEFDASEFLPSLPAEKIQALAESLTVTIDSVTNPHLKSLLKTVFEDELFKLSFQRSPAARNNHHNYVGGLLEHSLNVAKLCEEMCSFYNLDRDLLITGALLHDSGKTSEYAASASIEITDEGRLIGHIQMGAENISRKTGEIEGFPIELKNKIIHMILSHHGELEYGSPKRPAFPEAIALFHADYMDSSVKNTLQELEGKADEPWIYSKILRRHLTTK